jgi:hypothetical protein
MKLFGCQMLIADVWSSRYLADREIGTLLDVVHTCKPLKFVTPAVLAFKPALTLFLTRNAAACDG